jgi:hypoxia up-regulated 1
MKSMKQPYKSKRPTSKPKKPKAEEDVDEKGEGFKDRVLSEKGEKTLGFTEDGMPSVQRWARMASCLVRRRSYGVL